MHKTYVCTVGVNAGFTQITLLNLPLPASSSVTVKVYELSSDSLACPDALCKCCTFNRPVIDIDSLHAC